MKIWRDAKFFHKLAMIKQAGVGRRMGQAVVAGAKGLGEIALEGGMKAKALGVGTGIAGVGAYKSYNDPSGYLGRARMAYLRSRYAPGGALNSVARGLDYGRQTIHNITAPY